MSLIPLSIRKSPSLAALSDVARAEMAGLRELARVLAIMDVDAVPAAVLPYLAWQFRADVYTPDAPVAVRREQVRVALRIWRRRGTRWALRTALKQAGVTATIVEWWERSPAGVPHTFSVGLSDAADGLAVSGAKLAMARAAIDRVKPVRSQYELAQFFGVAAPARVAGAISARAMLAVQAVVRPAAGGAGAIGVGAGVGAYQLIHFSAEAS